MPTIEVSKIIHADKKRVYEVIKNMESFPEFMRDVKKVRVIERQGSRVVAEWKTDIDGASIEWVEEDIFDDKEMCIKFRMLDGDYKSYEGRWDVKELSNETEIKFCAEVDWGIPLLGKYVGKVLGRKMRANIKSMLGAIVKEVLRHGHGVTK